MTSILIAITFLPENLLRFVRLIIILLFILLNLEINFKIIILHYVFEENVIDHKTLYFNDNKNNNITQRIQNNIPNEEQHHAANIKIRMEINK